MENFWKEIFNKFGFGALIFALVAAPSVWILAHNAAAPGGKVSILWGFVEYTKRGEVESSPKEKGSKKVESPEEITLAPSIRSEDSIEGFEILPLTATEFLDYYYKIENQFDKKEIYKKRHFEKYVKWTVFINSITPSIHSEGFTIRWSDIDKGIWVEADFPGEEEKAISLKEGEKITLIGKLSTVVFGNEERKITVIFLEECRFLKEYSK